MTAAAIEPRAACLTTAHSTPRRRRTGRSSHLYATIFTLLVVGVPMLAMAIAKDEKAVAPFDPALPQMLEIQHAAIFSTERPPQADVPESASTTTTTTSASTTPTETTVTAKPAGQSLLVATAGVAAISAFGFFLFEAFRRALTGPHKQHERIPTTGAIEFARAYSLECAPRDAGAVILYHSPDGEVDEPGAKVCGVELHRGASFEARAGRRETSGTETDIDGNQFCSSRDISMATAPIAVSNNSADRFQIEHELM